MSKLEEMWAALTAYQPQADAAGHGATWAAMCKERTAAAAYAADDAFDGAAADAAYVAFDGADTEKWAQRVTDYINKATLKEKNNG